MQKLNLNSSVLFNKYVAVGLLVQILIIWLIIFLYNNYIIHTLFFIFIIIVIIVFKDNIIKIYNIIKNYILKIINFFLNLYIKFKEKNFKIKDFDDYIELEYKYKNSIFLLPIKKLKSSKRVLLITNEVGEDVTDEILKYFGPFYNIKYDFITPRHFQYEELSFELTDGTNKKINSDEIIDIEKLLKDKF